jgi:hypothetical protein
MHTLPIGHIKRKIAQVVPSVSRKGNIVRHDLSLLRLACYSIAHALRHALTVYSMALGIAYPPPLLHAHTHRAKEESRKVKSVWLWESRSIFILYISHIHSLPFFFKVKSLQQAIELDRLTRQNLKK